MTIKFQEWRERLLADPGVKAEYDALLREELRTSGAKAPSSGVRSSEPSARPLPQRLKPRNSAK